MEFLKEITPLVTLLIFFVGLFPAFNILLDAKLNPMKEDVANLKDDVANLKKGQMKLEARLDNMEGKLDQLLARG